MTAEVLDTLGSPEAERAAIRSRAFRLFAEALEYPDGDVLETITEGLLADALQAICTELDAELAGTIDWAALRDVGEGEDDLAVEFTRLFDAGVSGPPCPLYGGLYGGARMKTMEEAVRFYNHFQLKMSEKPRELPDHLSTQLEFLHFLAFREASAIQNGEDPGPFRRAQRDFLERHPGKWIPQLIKRLEGQKPMRFFLELMHALDGVLKRIHQEVADLTRE